MKVTEAGVELDAEFSVTSDKAGLALTIESRGGSRGAPNERNAQYADGLRVLLERLGERGARITDALVTSRTALRRYPDTAGRRLHVDGGYPVRVADHDPDTLRRAFGRAMRKAARDPQISSSGNNNKRVTFRLDLPSAIDSGLLGTELARGDDASGGTGGRVPLTSGPPTRRRSRAQGYVADAAYRRAVELRAMQLAIEHYEPDWEVEDTSAGSPYDLLLTRPGESRYVEVKGTAGRGEQINLTANEVDHARHHPGEVVLFIVHGIDVERADPAEPTAKGGAVRVIDPLDLDAGELRPTAFAWAAPRP